MTLRKGCPVTAAMNALRGKWKVQAVWHLSFGPKRFAELRNLLRGISEKVLTAQLRQLESDRLITRTATADSPPKVTYALSPSGQQLIPIMEDLCTWGSNHFGIVPNLPRPVRPA